MGWAKIDDRFCVHPKTLACSLAARGLWVSALSWVAGNGTDGVVPMTVVTMVGATAKHADELVRVGLWVVHERGAYAFKDYLDYNPDSDTLRARRAVRAAAGRVGGHRSAQARWGDGEAADGKQTGKQTLKQTVSKREANAEANGKQVGYDTCEANCNPVPVPVPVPEEEPSGSGTHLPLVGEKKAASVSEAVGHRRARRPPDTPPSAEFMAIWTAYPNKHGRAAAWAVWQRLGTPEIARAISAALSWQRREAEWLRDAGRFVPRLATYLHQRRWEDEPSHVPVAFTSARTAGNAAALAAFLSREEVKA
jgi:hypothetical protein